MAGEYLFHNLWIAFQTMSGYGIDRHLLGLKMIAIENDVDLPELFMDKAYSVSRTWKIATSQVIEKSCHSLLRLHRALHLTASLIFKHTTKIYHKDIRSMCTLLRLH